ncbi:hypothetical protein DSM112329_02931 [Paraconexibacter sp. AEG42_29]|uniref:Secreted protein n=1 Tax=Paraconexibacter sp. AEG42_29 TaxID=2997339 RepID=A0AAU7AWP5_9ACTN
MPSTRRLASYAAAVAAGAVLTPALGYGAGSNASQPFAAGHTCAAPGTTSKTTIAYGTRCDVGQRVLRAYLAAAPPANSRKYIRGHRCVTRSAKPASTRTTVSVRCLQTHGIQFVAPKP